LESEEKVEIKEITSLLVTLEWQHRMSKCQKKVSINKSCSSL